jgi:hypothetical protein
MVRAFISASGYPNLSEMNSRPVKVRLEGASKERTKRVRSARNGRRAVGGARVGDGCAAMSQDGHGVGTDPIYARS